MLSVPFSSPRPILPSCPDSEAHIRTLVEDTAHCEGYHFLDAVLCEKTDDGRDPLTFGHPHNGAEFQYFGANYIQVAIALSRCSSMPAASSAYVKNYGHDVGQGKSGYTPICSRFPRPNAAAAKTRQTLLDGYYEEYQKEVFHNSTTRELVDIDVISKRTLKLNSL